MPRWLSAALGAAAIAAFLAYGSLTNGDGPELDGGGTTQVVRVHDGDTLTVAGKGKIRLVQIDAPELPQGECFAEEAARELRRLAPVGSDVSVRGDRALADRDRFGRTLAYVFDGPVNVNLRLVELGAAAPYFYRGERGQYADALMAAVRRARATRRGLWGACPGTRLDPGRQVDARR